MMSRYLEDEDIDTAGRGRSPGSVARPPRRLEVGEDPVRLYLKEIGSIELLASDQEFWLATRLDAAQRLDILSRQHPLARAEPEAPQQRRNTRWTSGGFTTPCTRIWSPPGRALVAGYAPPGATSAPICSLVLSEAQMLRDDLAER